MYDILQLNDMLVPELKEIAEQLKIDNYKSLDKQDLIYKILDHQAVSPDNSGQPSRGRKSAPRKKQVADSEDKGESHVKNDVSGSENGESAKEVVLKDESPADTEGLPQEDAAVDRKPKKKESVNLR